MENCYSVLGSGGFWIINKKLAKQTSINAAIILADLISKREYFLINKDITLDDGWFFNTQENIETDTSLSAHEQRKAIEILVKNGFMEVVRRGVPAKNYFRICDNKILKFLISGCENFSQQEVKNFNHSYNNNKDIISKNNILIQENKKIKPPSPKEEDLFLKNKKKEIVNLISRSDAVVAFASDVVVAWNSFGVNQQKNVHESKMDNVKKLFEEGNTINDYRLVVSNMIASGDFKKQGKNLTIMATLDLNYFYRYKAWKKPPSLYKTLE